MKPFRHTPDSVSEMQEVLRRLEQAGFYGSLEIKFEAGRVVLVRKTETIKPGNCRDNRVKNDERRSFSIR